jgi:hypothetical protein
MPPNMVLVMPFLTTACQVRYLRISVPSSWSTANATSCPMICHRPRTLPRSANGHRAARRYAPWCDMACEPLTPRPTTRDCGAGNVPRRWSRTVCARSRSRRPWASASRRSRQTWRRPVTGHLLRRAPLPLQCADGYPHHQRDDRDENRCLRGCSACGRTILRTQQ